MDFSIPLSGLNQATASLNVTAAKLARVGGSAQAGDTLNLSADMVAMMQARESFSTNLKVSQTADDMTKALLNLVG